MVSRESDRGIVFRNPLTATCDEIFLDDVHTEHDDGFHMHRRVDSEMEGPFVSEEKLNGNSNLVEIFGKGSRDLEAQSSYHRETEPLLAQRDMIVNIHLELTQGVCGSFRSKYGFEKT